MPSYIKRRDIGWPFVLERHKPKLTTFFNFDGYLDLIKQASFISIDYLLIIVRKMSSSALSKIKIRA